MYCSRCGHRNERDDRFCSSCGESLRPAAPGSEGRSLRDRLGALVGTTRSARLATVGTVIAIVVAIVALLALADDEDVPRDDYTLAAEALCVDAKVRISAGRPGAQEASSNPGGFAAEIVAITTEWRSSFNDLVPPSDRADAASAMSEALIGVIVRAGALARTPEASEGEVVEQGRRVDEATAEVEAAVDELGLERCSALEITPGGLAGE